VISKTVLVLAEPFGDGLDGEHVASALARGLTARGQLDCDCCGLEEDPDTRARAAALLDECDFDRRMRSARAVVIARERLDDRTLAGSVAFEAATRARQGGVPAYAVTAHDELDPFEARIVDLQVVLEAANTRALGAAGRKLAALV
jgi:Glycerate kinase family